MNGQLAVLGFSSGRQGFGRWCLALACCVATGAFASAPDVSELVPSGHWAQEAVEELEELGLLEVYLPAQNTLTRAQVHAALSESARRAVQVAPQLAPLAAAQLARFEEEFPTLSPEEVPALTLRGLSATTGLALLRSRGPDVDPGSVDRRHVPFQDDTTVGVLSLRGSATFTRHLAISVVPEISGMGSQLRAWEAVVGWGGLELSAGRTPVAYGLRRGRGAIMSGQRSFDRLELRTSAPFMLPGWLRHLGWWAVDVFATRVHELRHPGNPYLWGMSIRVKPHPRLAIGAQRGVMFGGGALPDARGRNFWKMLFATSNQQENNLGSADILLRLPTEALLPLTLYGEWAADDLGAQFKAPGLMAGIRTPAIPNLPEVSLGGEFAFFGVLCCRVHTWYEHGNHVGGWVLDGAPLGHPMGGDGRELRLYGTANMFQARLEVDAQVMTRQRFATNLFAPYRPGRSIGLAASLRWRLARRAELGVSWDEEWGRGWRTGAFAAQASAFF